MSPGFQKCSPFLPAFPSTAVNWSAVKFGSRLIGIVTLCLLPLLASFDVRRGFLLLSQVIWGQGSILACLCRRQDPATLDILSALLKEQLTRRAGL